MTYAMTKVLAQPQARALELVQQALQSEGFGVLTTIDVRQTFKDKLGLDFRPYRILGACNPPLAHRALQADPNVGLMMPCNIIVYEDGPSRTVVSAIDPMQTMAAAGSAPVREVAAIVQRKLQSVLDKLEPGGSP